MFPKQYSSNWLLTDSGTLWNIFDWRPKTLLGLNVYGAGKLLLLFKLLNQIDMANLVIKNDFKTKKITLNSDYNQTKYNDEFYFSLKLMFQNFKSITKENDLNISEE